jgi:hypothetical protein
LQEQDEAWEKRGNTALVYDATYERHWDKWTGPKQLSLFSVRLSVGSDRKWSLGSEFLNLLNDAGHVRLHFMDELSFLTSGLELSC